MRKFTLFLAAIAACISVNAQRYNAGEINARFDDECNLLVWVEEEPDYLNAITKTRIEYTTYEPGQGFQTFLLGYVPAIVNDTMKFQVPWSGEIRVRRYVQWQEPSGTTQSWSRYTTIQCGVNEPRPKIEFFGSNIVIESEWPGQIRVFDMVGTQVMFHEFEGFSDFDFSVLSPGLFYFNVLVFDPAGLISETYPIWH